MGAGFISPGKGTAVVMALPTHFLNILPLIDSALLNGIKNFLHKLVIGESFIS